MVDLGPLIWKIGGKLIVKVERPKTCKYSHHASAKEHSTRPKEPGQRVGGRVRESDDMIDLVAQSTMVPLYMMYCHRKSKVVRLNTAAINGGQTG